MRKGIIILTVFLLLSAGAAFCNSITWTLQNAKFDDGGIATGYFTYDSTTDTFGAYHIDVSGGDTTTFPDFAYGSDVATSEGPFSYAGNGFVRFMTMVTTSIDDRELRLPTWPLDTPGVVSFDFSNIYQGECYDCAPWRPFVSGEISGIETAGPGPTVPEPATFLLLASGLVGIALRKRKLSCNR